MKNILLHIVLFQAVFTIQAQELQNNENGFQVEHHQVGLLLAHTNLREGNVNSGNSRISVPSFNLFYNYHFNQNWMLGLHTDFVTEQFIVESFESSDKIIERKRPIAPAIMLGYKPSEHFTLGGGIDIDGDETLSLMRCDIEYGLAIKRGWEFVAAFGYDIRFSAFDSFQLGVGVARGF